MSSELAGRPVPCRAEHCGGAGPMNEMVRASKVLRRENARGWFCPSCAENGGTRFIQTTACTPVYVDLIPSPIVERPEWRTINDLILAAPCDDWLQCTEHSECAALVAFCEAKHDRYGEALFPRG